MFRITGGQFKGKKLLLPPESVTRPTSTRTREALFSILFSMERALPEMHFLDGFAGSGAVGIEALSRGAQFVTFVEHDLTIQRVLRENTKSMGVNNFSVLRRFEEVSRKCDVIFLDPPYGLSVDGKMAYVFALEDMDTFIDQKSLIIIETDHREDVDVEGYEVLTIKPYGLAKLTFMRKL